MALSEFEIAKIKKLVGEFCGNRVPSHIRDKLRMDFRSEVRNLYFRSTPSMECPTQSTESMIAKIKYVKSTKEQSYTGNEEI